MEKRHHAITITVHNKDLAYDKVGEILHIYADKILLRVGYPVPDKDHAIIFIVVLATQDELGAMSGKLGQIESVKVKTVSLKI